MLKKEAAVRTEHWFCDSSGKPVHLMEAIYKNEPRIITYPFAYSESRGVVKKRITEIELRGWANLAEVPPLLRVRTH